MAAGGGSHKAVSVEDRAFLEGLGVAIRETDADVEQTLVQTGHGVVRVAQGLVRRHSGELAGSIKVQGSGMTQTGPYVDVGTTNDHAIFQEYGTAFMPAKPYMRPALSMAAKVTGVKRTPSRRERLFTQRANKRAQIRKSLKRGDITREQARGLSEAVSNKFRYRTRRQGRRR
jgi:HK97 gp10 family phage protein